MKHFVRSYFGSSRSSSNHLLKPAWLKDMADGDAAAVAAAGAAEAPDLGTQLTQIQQDITQIKQTLQQMQQQLAVIVQQQDTQVQQQLAQIQRAQHQEHQLWQLLQRQPQPVQNRSRSRSANPSRVSSAPSGVIGAPGSR